MSTPKREAQELLDGLPDDVSMDTLVAELQFRASVLRGLAQADRGEGISHAELNNRIDAWQKSSGRRKPSKI